MQSAFEFLISLLPNYFITNISGDENEQWRCRSNTGITSEEKWQAVFKEIKSRWQNRFIEIYQCQKY